MVLDLGMFVNDQLSMANQITALFIWPVPTSPIPSDQLCHSCTCLLAVSPLDYCSNRWSRMLSWCQQVLPYHTSWFIYYIVV